MILERKDNKIEITLDAPWEAEVVEWIFQVYGPNHLKNHLSTYLYSKERSMTQYQVQQEVNDRLARRRDAVNRVSSPSR